MTLFTFVIYFIIASIIWRIMNMIFWRLYSWAYPQKPFSPPLPVSNSGTNDLLVSAHCCICNATIGPAVSFDLVCGICIITLKETQSASSR